MLTENDIKEELSYAYVHAVASRAGFGCDCPKKDRDSIDVVISAHGQLSPDAQLFSPRIELQLKATAVPRGTGERFSFSLPLKNYNDLRERTMLPRLLVVFMMPENSSEWLTTDAKQLILRRCAYWRNLQGAPDSENTSMQSVTISRRNPFSPDVLRQLMTKAACREEIGDEL